MPIIIIVFAFSNLIAVGASVHISALLRKINREDASRVFSFPAKVNLLLSGLIGITGLLFAKLLVRLLAPGTIEQSIAYGVAYVMCFSSYFIALERLVR